MIGLDILSIYINYLGPVIVCVSRSLFTSGHKMETGRILLLSVAVAAKKLTSRTLDGNVVLNVTLF